MGTTGPELPGLLGDAAERPGVNVTPNMSAIVARTFASGLAGCCCRRRAGFLGQNETNSPPGPNLQTGWFGPSGVVLEVSIWGPFQFMIDRQLLISAKPHKKP